MFNSLRVHIWIYRQLRLFLRVTCSKPVPASIQQPYQSTQHNAITKRRKDNDKSAKSTINISHNLNGETKTWSSIRVNYKFEPKMKLKIATQILFVFYESFTTGAAKDRKNWHRPIIDQSYKIYLTGNYYSKNNTAFFAIHLQIIRTRAICVKTLCVILLFIYLRKNLYTFLWYCKKFIMFLKYYKYDLYLK